MRQDPSADLSSVAVVVAGPPAVRDTLAAALGTSGPAIAIADDRCGGLEALHIACRCLQAGDCETAVVSAADGTIAMVLARADTIEPDEIPVAAWIDACVWAAPETAPATAWALAGGAAGSLRTVQIDTASGGLVELARNVATSDAKGRAAYVAAAPDGRHAVCAVLRPDRGRMALAAPAEPHVEPALPPSVAPSDGPPPHPLLGKRLPSPVREIQFAAWIGPATHSWTVDHRVFDTSILPAAAMVEMMIAAAIAGPGWPDSEVVLRDLHIRRPLPFDGEDAAAVATVLTPAGGSRLEAAIHSRMPGQQDWNLHAVGILEQAAAERAAPVDVRALRRQLGDEVPLADHYAGNATRGIVYGPAFQGLALLCRGRGRALALLHRPPAAIGEGHLIHPALLDAAIQVVPTAFETPPDGAYVPVAIAEARFAANIPDELWCEATARGAGGEGRTRVADLRLFARDGRVVVAIQGIELVHTDAETLARSASESDSKPVDRPSSDAKDAGGDSVSLGDLFPAERRARLVQVVQDACVAILGLPTDASIDRSAGFFTIGFDSMAAVDLHRRLQPSLGIDFPATAVFDHSSVTALVDYLDGRLATADVAPIVPARAESSLSAAVEAMSAEEAEAELLQEIEKTVGSS